MLESAYESCLAYELRSQGLRVERQKPRPIRYKEVQLDRAYRIDLLVEGEVVVEIKAVDGLLTILEAQLLSYLRFSECKIGLLLNFNVTLLKKPVYDAWYCRQETTRSYPDMLNHARLTCISLRHSA